MYWQYDTFQEINSLEHRLPTFSKITLIFKHTWMLIARPSDQTGKKLFPTLQWNLKVETVCSIKPDKAWRKKARKYINIKLKVSGIKTNAGELHSFSFFVFSLNLNWTSHFMICLLRLCILKVFALIKSVWRPSIFLSDLVVFFRFVFFIWKIVLFSKLG